MAKSGKGTRDEEGKPSPAPPDACYTPPVPAASRKHHRQSVTLEPAAVRVLERRGAHPDRGRGPLGTSATINRALAQFEMLMARTAVSLEARYFSALLEIVPEPWNVSPTEIAVLDQYLPSTPDFSEVLKRHGIGTAELLDAVKALDVAQRVVLVDQLVQAAAPQHLI